MKMNVQILSRNSANKMFVYKLSLNFLLAAVRIKERREVRNSKEVHVDQKTTFLTTT